MYDTDSGLKLKPITYPGPYIGGFLSPVTVVVLSLNIVVSWIGDQKLSIGIQGKQSKIV